MLRSPLPARRLLQHPGPSLVSKDPPVLPKRRSLSIGMNDLGFANIVRSETHQVHFHDRADRQLSRGGSQESADTHILSRRFLVHFVSLTVRTPQLERDAQT